MLMMSSKKTDAGALTDAESLDKEWKGAHVKQFHCRSWNPWADKRIGVEDHKMQVEPRVQAHAAGRRFPCEKTKSEYTDCIVHVFWLHACVCVFTHPVYPVAQCKSVEA